MTWPWQRRVEAAEEKARASEAELRRAEADHAVARRVADASRKARKQNGFTELIRTALGVDQ